MTEHMYEVQYGNTTIQYTLTFAQRTTFAISVAPDLRVEVAAPVGTTLSTVEAKVRQRAAWILRQQRELEQYLPTTPPRQYVSGETHRYLGRQYRLKVIEDQIEGVKLSRGWLSITTIDKTDSGHVQHLLDTWYTVQAQRVFPERLVALLPRFRHVGITETPELVIKPLKARWGSCSGSGRITLNLRLMQVPKHFIEYVIVHELCHLVEHNHSKRFYLLLDRMLPDWRERRVQLNALEVS